MIRALTEIADQYPVTAVHRVVSRFIAGEVEGQSLEFAPKPPRFAKELQREQLAPDEQEYIRSRVRDEVGRRRQIEAPSKIEHSPASIKRVGELLSKFKRGEPVRP